MNRRLYRELWEEFHGINIPKGWDIHHIDSNHCNNTLGNLLACPRKAHIKLHELKGERNSANLLKCGKAVSGEANPMHNEDTRKKSGKSISLFWGNLNPEDRELIGRREQKKFLKFYLDNPEAYVEQSIERWKNPSDKMNESRLRLNAKVVCCIYCSSKMSKGTFSKFHGENCKQRDKHNELI